MSVRSRGDASSGRRKVSEDEVWYGQKGMTQHVGYVPKYSLDLPRWDRRGHALDCCFCSFADR